MPKWLLAWNIVLTVLLILTIVFSVRLAVVTDEILSNHWGKMTEMAGLIDEQFSKYDKALLWLGDELDEAFEKVQERIEALER